MNTAAARDTRDTWAGRVIDGRFTLLQWLASSARGDVFLAELRGPGSRRVAVRLIAADTAGAETRLADWAATTTLSHPHLTRLFDAGRCEINGVRLIYAVTEYAEEDLAQILPERPLTPSETEDMLHPVLDALSYLHERGFVHGHLKPSNIMAVDNRVKLSCDRLQVMGKPGKHLPAPTIHDAPEFASRPISPAADVWSLGVTLVEALTQRPPVWDRSSNREPFVPETIPQPFADIARDCLRTDPARRCPLSEVKARLGPARPVPETASSAGTLPDKRRAMVAIAAVLVLAAILAAVGLRSHPAQPSLQSETRQPVPAAVAPRPQPPAPETQPVKGVVKGAVVERVVPNVPRNASRTIQGKVKVRLRVMVDPSGDVSNVKFESEGPSKYFANLAQQAARQWKFKPAQVDGEAAASAWILRFQFGQSATEVTPAEASP